MIPILLSFVLAVGLAPQQPQTTNPRPSGDPSHSGDDAPLPASLKPDDPVITVRGICKDSPAKAGDSPDCKTIVTKEQFERLTAAVATAGQPVPLKGRRQLAQTYVDLLAYAQAARSSGIEESPEFRDLMDLIRLRTLAEIHRRNLQTKYHTPSPQDIDDYYHQNLANFMDMKIRRILISRKNPAVQNQDEYEKRALQIMDKLRERAAKGEDFDQLQREGYTTLGLTSVPGTDMGNRRKANLLPEVRDEILALNAGGVSKVEAETFSFVIYKVETKHLLTEDTVKAEISQEISRQRLENALKEITAGAHPEFNQQYFPAAPSPPADSSDRPPAGLQQPGRAHR